MIGAGKMAENKAISGAVRNYGELLAGDHRQADQMLQDFAKRKRVELVNGPPMGEGLEPQAADIQRIKALNGLKFDAVFVQAMVKTHQRAVAMLGKASQQVQDRELRGMLEQELAIVHQELQLAQNLAQGEPG